MSKMNIRDTFRKYLLESEGDTHDYGCVMLYFDINKTAWNKFQDMIADDDLYIKEGDLSYGREDTPHVTILYGLHADIPDSTIKELIDEMEGPTLNLKKISIFENEEYDVVKFDIIGDSKKRLSKMNAKFAKLPHTTDYPDYHPHSTIAYVKKGKGKQYAKTISSDDVITVSPKEVAYSKADGSKKKYKLK
jgi:2'-5' RNA ligase